MFVQRRPRRGGGRGRPSVSQTGHPADVQTQGVRPTRPAPGRSSEQGRAAADSAQEPTLAGWEGPSDGPSLGLFQLLFWNNRTFSWDDFCLSSKLRCNLHLVKSTLRACRRPASLTNTVVSLRPESRCRRVPLAPPKPPEALCSQHRPSPLATAGLLPWRRVLPFSAYDTNGILHGRAISSNNVGNNALGFTHGAGHIACSFLFIAEYYSSPRMKPTIYLLSTCGASRLFLLPGYSK